MTTEQKLQAIIEAQVKGGCDNLTEVLPKLAIGRQPQDREWSFYENHLWMNEYREDTEWPIHLLTILLDPAGLKAAYGEEISNSGIYAADGRHRLRPKAYVVGHQILDTWYASNGDAEKTIETAFSLLPANNV